MSVRDAENVEKARTTTPTHAPPGRAVPGLVPGEPGLRAYRIGLDPLRRRFGRGGGGGGPFALRWRKASTGSGNSAGSGPLCDDIDDCIVMAPNERLFEQRMHHVLRKMRRLGIRIKTSKAALWKRELKFLGFRLRHGSQK